MRVLGIDLGSKRIGIAISNSEGTVATPYEVVHRSGDRARDHRAILELATEAGVEALVVGLPLNTLMAQSDALREMVEGTHIVPALPYGKEPLRVVVRSCTVVASGSE